MASPSTPSPFPLPKFHFKVTLDGNEIDFQEVTGLTVENEFTEYRNGSDKGFIPARRASIRKSGTVSFKKGLIKGDDKLISLYNKITKVETNFSTDKTIVNLLVVLLDEESKEAFSWSIANAVPIKLTMESLSASDNAIAIEQIDFTHSGIEIKSL